MKAQPPHSALFGIASLKPLHILHLPQKNPGAFPTLSRLVSSLIESSLPLLLAIRAFSAVKLYPATAGGGWKPLDAMEFNEVKCQKEFTTIQAVTSQPIHFLQAPGNAGSDAHCIEPGNKVVDINGCLQHRSLYGNDSFPF